VVLAGIKEGVALDKVCMIRKYIAEALKNRTEQPAKAFVHMQKYYITGLVADCQPLLCQQN
jgi:hypothetical protein